MLIALLLVACTPIHADEHKKRIDFDGELVEGVNKKAYDSLSHIHQKDRAGNRVYLYEKPKHFSNTELLNDLEVKHEY